MTPSARMGSCVLDALDPYNLKHARERVNEIRDLAAVSADLGFLRRAQQATLPLIDRPHPVDSHVFPPLKPRLVEALHGRRIAVITSGGCVALIEVGPAFEEAAINPALISCCSGSVIWGAMWAAGLSAQEMVEFSLSWRPEEYLDIQWARLPRFLFSALHDFTGLAKGEAIERLFDSQTWSRPAGKLQIPRSTIVYNMDLGELEYFGSARTPGVTVGPRRFRAEDVTGWQTHRLGVLQASRQLQQGYHLELACRSQRQLGDRLTLIDPIDYRLLRGVSFYDLFIDRRQWPEPIRQGYRAARGALEAFGAHQGKPARRRATNDRRPAPSASADG
jgi:hypothetical protein